MLSKTKSRDAPEGVVVAKERISLYNMTMILFLTIGSLAVAMPSAIISTTLGQPSFLIYFDLLTATGIKAGLVAAMNGVFYFGGVVGLILLSFLADPLGRKSALRYGAIAAIIFNALLAGSVHIAMFITFRFFSGAAASFCLGCVPVLMAEIAPPHKRGFMVGMFGTALACGYSLASWFGVAFYFVHNEGAQWRVPLALTAVPSVLVLALLPLVPESPRWLVMKERIDEAARVIHRLHGGKDIRMEDFANLEIEQIKAQIAFERQNHVSWAEFLTSKKYARRAWTAAFAFMTSQSAGILAIVTYAAAISESIGYGPVAQLCFSAGYLTMGILAAIIGSLVIDRVGRVRLLVIGTITQVVLLAIFTGLVAKYAGTTNTAANKACIALIFLYFLTYGVCIESCVYTYVSELFPSHVRAKGVSFGIMFLYLTDIPFVVGSIYAFGTIGWRFYLVFIIVPLFMLAVLYALAKETKGKSLEEIGAIFGDELVVRTLDEQIEDERRGIHGAVRVNPGTEKEEMHSEIEEARV